MRSSNGDGTIYKDEARKTWVAEITWIDRAGDKQRKRWRDKKQAVVKQKLKEFKKQLLLTDGNVGGETSVLFEEYAEYWLREILQPQLKPSSYLRKEVTLKYQVYPYIGSIPIEKIEATDIRDMMKAIGNNGRSYSTIKKAYEAVNGCMRQYIISNKSVIMRNPCEEVKLPKNLKEEDDVIYFNQEQRQKIVEEATRCYSTGTPVYRMGQAIPLLMYTGMRIGELLALTWNDVDFVNNTISINKNAVVVKEDGQYKLVTQKSTKTKSGTRIIPISSHAKTALLSLKEITGNEPYVICTKNHKQVVPRKINENFHHILQNVGIMSGDASYGVHSLRHTFASMLFENGCSVKVVSELLGHSNTAITENTYIHLIQAQKVKAIQGIDQFTD